MKPWLDFVVVLMPNHMHKKTLSNWASRHSTWLIPRIGIFFDTLVYTGAETLKEASPEFESLPQPGRVVMHLMRHYFNSNHHVYRPVVYKHTCDAVAGCSQHLLHWHCHENCIDLPDMIRAKSFSLKQGDHLSFNCEQLLVTAWRAEGKDKMFIILAHPVQQ